MRTTLNSIIGALRRPLMIDRRGFAREYGTALEVELGYVELASSYTGIAGWTTLMTLPPIWVDGRTPIKLEAYFSNCRSHPSGSADFQARFTGGGIADGAARWYELAGACSIFACGSYDGFYTPLAGLHTFTVDGNGLSASITVGGGAAPSFLRCYVLRKR